MFLLAVISSTHDDDDDDAFLYNRTHPYVFLRFFSFLLLAWAFERFLCFRICGKNFAFFLLASELTDYTHTHLLDTKS